MNLKDYKLNPDQVCLTWCRQILLRDGQTTGDRERADKALHGIMNHQPHQEEF